MYINWKRKKWFRGTAAQKDNRQKMKRNVFAAVAAVLFYFEYIDVQCHVKLKCAMFSWLNSLILSFHYFRRINWNELTAPSFYGRKMKKRLDLIKNKPKSEKKPAINWIIYYIKLHKIQIMSPRKIENH